MLTIANTLFSSRLLTGTGKFSDSDTMIAALQTTETVMTTMALRRIDVNSPQDPILMALKSLPNVAWLPNTSGAKSAKEAIFAAELLREALGTHWIKLEIHPDPQYLMPDPIETLKAAEILVEKGFTVLPYCHADPVLCQRLEAVGCAAVMPLGSPIGSNQGLASETFLSMIIEQATVPVIVDAGIGSPSDATKAMELGADGVLVNTAIATAGDPILMAKAFRLAVQSGRLAYEARLAEKSQNAQASSPLTAFLL